MKIAIIFIIAVSILLLLNVILGLTLSILISRPKTKSYIDYYFFSPFETGVPSEKVAFETEDGLTLRGWLLPGRDNRAVICLCGRMGTKSDLLGVGSCLNRAGYNVLLFDYRGCGESDSSTMSMGQLERMDVKAAVDFIVKKIPSPRIGIIGFSMGASLGIVHASTDKRISALVCDSPFTSSEELILNRIRRFFPLPLFLLRPLTRLFTKFLFGYDNRGLDVKGSAKRLSLKNLLVVVSEKDCVIEPSQQREIFDAASHPKEVWKLEDADHCGAYFLNRGEYVSRVAAFFDDALS
ncbi:MAG: alpha/beta fold hydrolase [Deltaproteobacteria bacterium]|uniref:Alpha/beta fold hydrolase n=1 Tax=Candidatus Zymogenus saltonus TaxID=2844893 RepID=A0A9D8KCV8_9DELT|nr:alpha/beta fold hydrolase [Candidatus Zymogenus saltonus]